MEANTLVYGGSFQASLLRRRYMTAVFGWMALALAVTGIITEWFCSVSVVTNMIVNNAELFVALFIVEVFLVFGLSTVVSRLSLGFAVFVFIAYALLNGISLSALFYLFTRQSPAFLFYIISTAFGVCGLYGLLTSRNMSRPGNIAGLAFTGLLIATFCNYFFHMSLLYWLISYMGIVVFSLLALADVRQIRMMSERAAIDRQTCWKSGVFGALILYLDFVNLFLFFLRIFGRRR